MCSHFWAVLAFGYLASPATAGPVGGLDRINDTTLRPTDAGVDGLVDLSQHHLPDIRSYTIGRWAATDPAVQLFAGEWLPHGDFFRLDVTFTGLINPPGTLGGIYPFDPFLHGPHPVFGYIEIDIDADVETGGELAASHQRYTGNAARFGGRPSDPRYADRIALDSSSFDDNFATSPKPDRSGEEFHIALHGWEIDNISRSDEHDTIFDPGETWIVSGKLFHRAHGYEKFSYACCQGTPGSYEPMVQLQFQHSIELDQTTLSLVYPLTHVAAASMTGGPVQPLDGDASNDHSIEEALDDLIFGVLYATVAWQRHPKFPVISGWGVKNAADYLDPAQWRINLIVGTSYTTPEPSLYVWTDAMPDVVTGDFYADTLVNAADVAVFDSFLACHDGSPTLDADQVVNGCILIGNFGPNFSLYDLNYDGQVDATDREILQSLRTTPGDFDGDRDVDSVDFASLQVCLGEPVAEALPLACSSADLDKDGRVDSADLLVFEACASGPALAADVECAD